MRSAAPASRGGSAEFLVRCGIDNISVNPDAVIATRNLVANVEQKILLERLARLEKKWTKG